MRRFRAKTLVLAGIFVIVIGFLYDMRFAGLPFQDPTTEMQANWLFHSKIASSMVLSGIVLLLTGIVWALINLAAQVSRKRG